MAERIQPQASRIYSKALRAEADTSRLQDGCVHAILMLLQAVLTMEGSSLRRRRPRHQSREEYVVRCCSYDEILTYPCSFPRTRGVPPHPLQEHARSCGGSDWCVVNKLGMERLFSRARTGLKLTKAYSYLSDVSDHKQVIPFRRFSGGVGRASQAKQFKATQGTYFLCK